MKMISTLAIATIISLSGSSFALADNHHGHKGPRAYENHLQKMDGVDSRGDMMQNMMRMMMPMMMQMHGQMAGHENHGPARRQGMATMDRSMMRMMMGKNMVGVLAPDATQEAMLARLGEFDADKDGSLSLSEFEKLHAALIHETTVDRFQHLDSDGDGRVTKEEMTAPAKRMEMRRMMMNKTPADEPTEVAPDN